MICFARSNSQIPKKWSVPKQKQNDLTAHSFLQTACPRRRKGDLGAHTPRAPMAPSPSRAKCPRSRRRGDGQLRCPRVPEAGEPLRAASWINSGRPAHASPACGRTRRPPHGAIAGTYTFLAVAGEGTRQMDAQGAPGPRPARAPLPAQTKLLTLAPLTSTPKGPRSPRRARCKK